MYVLYTVYPALTVATVVHLLMSTSHSVSFLTNITPELENKFIDDKQSATKSLKCQVVQADALKSQVI